MKIQMKRIYDSADPADGFRVLVDRLWPRGVSKEKASIDLWAKDITPGTRLREEFHSGTKSWPEFEKLYHMELSHNPALPEFLETLKKHDPATLLSAVKDLERSHVKILMDVIREQANV